MQLSAYRFLVPIQIASPPAAASSPLPSPSPSPFPCHTLFQHRLLIDCVRPLLAQHEVPPIEPAAVRRRHRRRLRLRVRLQVLQELPHAHIGRMIVRLVDDLPIANDIVHDLQRTSASLSPSPTIARTHNNTPTLHQPLALLQVRHIRLLIRVDERKVERGLQLLDSLRSRSYDDSDFVGDSSSREVLLRDL